MPASRIIIAWIITTLAHLTLAAAAQDSAPSPEEAPPPVQVVIEGVSDELKVNIESVLSIYKARQRRGLRPFHIRRLQAESDAEIRLALQPFGYYDAGIEPTLERQADGTWLARYVIDPGERVKIAEVDIRLSGEGEDAEPLRRAVERFPLTVGDELSHQIYEDGKRVFTATASEMGFFDAGFKSRELRVDLQSYTATITLHYDTGPRYRFGEVRFEQDLFVDGFLKQFVAFEAGDPYRLADLRELQDQLTNSDYFGTVEVLSRPEVAEDLRVPITVRVTPGKKWRFDTGLGYGTDTGPRGTFQWNWRRLNRQGHHAEIDLRGSELENGLRLSYHLPFQQALFLPSRQPRLELVTLGLAHAEIDTDTYETIKSFAGARSTRHRGRWRESFSLAVHRDDFTVGVDSGEVVAVIPSAEWTLVSSDNRLYPHRGFRLGLEVSGAHESALSDVTVLRVKSSAKWVRTFGPDGAWGRRHKVIARGEAGAITSEDFRRLPPSFRFFTGGDQSVRGYDYESLGDLDEAGNVIGGERLFVGSLEYEYLIREKWGVAVFFDTGSAGRDLADRLSEGAGVGVGWRSPVGPVRVDFAWAISEPDAPMRIHFRIGPDL